MQVEVLHLTFLYGESAAFKFMTSDLFLNIQLCSATLTELCLEGLHVEHCFLQFGQRRYAPGQDLKVTAGMQLVAAVCIWSLH